MHIKNFMEKNRNNIFIISVLLLIGFLLRLYAFKYTYVINNDGIVYIESAKAILNGDWNFLRECFGIVFGLYPFFISFFYKIFGDWVVAAKAVSLLFGILSIIPFYLILRQFFNNIIAIVTTLAFAVNPYFVEYSVEVLRDQMFWFFLLFGVFFFVAAFNSNKKDHLLIFSSISFLIAALARIEILVYFVASVIYILLSKSGKVKRLALFLLPIFVLSAIISAMPLMTDLNLWNYYFKPRLSSYGLLTAFYDVNIMYELISNVFHKLLDFFKVLSDKLLKIIYLPFLPFLFIGIYNIKNELKRDRNFIYFLFLTVLSVLTLCLFYIKMEVFSSRYTVIVIFPLFVLMGSGIEKGLVFLKQKGLKERTVVWSICFYIIAFTLLPNLEHRREDKLIYKKIGEYIALKEENMNVRVMGPDNRIMFYANLSALINECTVQFGDYEHFQKMKYHDLIYMLREKRVKYFAFEDKKWKADYDFLATVRHEHFKEISRWEDTHRGKLVLFEVRDMP